jgi:structural maintenance of chromosome 2
MGQIADAKALLAQGQAEEEQSRVKLGMREQEFEGLKRKMKESEREIGESQKKVEKMRNEVERLREKLARCKWSREHEEGLESRLKSLKERIRELTDVRDFFLAAYTDRELTRATIL